jgi:hypothetical protein
MTLMNDPVNDSVNDSVNDAVNDPVGAGQADIRVIRGRPADDEVAALVAVLLSLAAERAAAAATAAEAAGVDDRPEPGWTGKPAYRPPGAWTSVQVARPMIRRVKG